MRKLYRLLACAVVVVLAGCYESSSVTVHKPGVYKGERDPLLSGNASERSNSLNERFRLGQLDR